MKQTLHARHGKALGTAALIVALMALTLAVFAVVYVKQVAPLHAGTDDASQLYMNMTGIANAAAKNTLAPQYSDADGDLVADAPTDPTKQIDPPTLKFTYVAVEDDAEFKVAFKELIAALSQATGKSIEFVSYPSIDDKLRDLRDGKLQICGLATGAVPIGVCTAGFVPLVQAADAQGGSGYHLQIIVPAGSSITKLTDLRGHELCLTEPTSNSGYKAPLILMRENGMTPPRDYLLRYSQGHTQSIEGIKAKKFDAASVAGDVLQREESAGQIAKGDYNVIYTSDQLFPAAAIGIAYNLKPDLAAKIKATLLGFDWKGTGLEKLFAAEGKVKFVAADYKKSWDYVRRIDESIGFAYTLSAAPASTQPTTQTAAAN